MAALQSSYFKNYIARTSLGYLNTTWNLRSNFIWNSFSINSIPSMNYQFRIAVNKPIVDEEHILWGKKPSTKQRLKAKLKRSRRKFGKAIDLRGPMRRQTKFKDLF